MGWHTAEVCVYVCVWNKSTACGTFNNLFSEIKISNQINNIDELSTNN